MSIEEIRNHEENRRGIYDSLTILKGDEMADIALRIAKLVYDEVKARGIEDKTLESFLKGLIQPSANPGDGAAE